MDLSKIVLNQVQNSQLNISGKPQKAESEATTEGDFLKTMAEFLSSGKQGGSTIEEDLLSGGNELPREGIESATLNELSGDELSLEALAELKEEIGEELSAFLNGLPAAVKAELGKGQIKSAVDVNISSKQAAEISPALRIVSELLQQKGAKLATVQADVSSLKGGAPQASDKASQVGLMASMSPQLNSLLSTKEQLPVMSKPLGSSDWGRELADRISWMAGKTIQVAELRLNPARLGPVEVKIQIHQEQATVMFSSPHAAVREALEQAAPRLREMMTAQQYEQVNVDVSGHSSSDQQAAREKFNHFGESVQATGTAEESTLEEASTSSPLLMGDGLLNYYV
jgi:flagellar hook-length control protein FliK